MSSGWRRRFVLTELNTDAEMLPIASRMLRSCSLTESFSGWPKRAITSDVQASRATVVLQNDGSD